VGTLIALCDWSIPSQLVPTAGRLASEPRPPRLNLEVKAAFVVAAG
jgi:hypothetical protein